MAGLQIGGLASGLDTGTIITQLMSLERRPIQSLQNKQQTLQTRKAALSDLASKLSALRGKTANLQLSTTTQGRTATSSKPEFATATAGANAAKGSYTLKVTTLATRTRLTGTAQAAAAVAGATALSGPSFSVPVTSGTFTVKVGAVSKTFTVDAAVDTVQSVLNKLNAAGTGFGAGFASLTANKLRLTNGSAISVGAGGDTSNFLDVTKLSTAVSGTTVQSVGPVGVVQANAVFASANLATPPVGTSGAFSVNNVTINWDATDTLNSVIGKINSSAANVQASYDTATDKLTLEAKGTGNEAISLQHLSGGNLLNSLKVLTATQTIGSNANYDLGDGIQRYSQSNAVTDALAGVTLNLVAPGTTALTIGQDTTAGISAVKEFVAAYNAAVGLVQEQTKVDAASKKASVLTGDSIAMGVEPQLRRVLSARDTGLTTALRDLASIGLSSGAVGSAAGNTKTMVLDEAKLTKALQDDPQAVSNLLTSPTGPLASLNSYLTQVTAAGSGLSAGQTSADTLITSLGKQITRMEERMDIRQAALERKFAALEVTMSRLQGQSAQLTGLMSQLGGTR